MLWICCKPYIKVSPKILISTDLIARYGRGVQAEAAPGPQPVVDRHDDDVRLYEEVRPVEDALACGESPSVEPDQDWMEMCDHSPITGNLPGNSSDGVGSLVYTLRMRQSSYPKHVNKTRWNVI